VLSHFTYKAFLVCHKRPPLNKKSIFIKNGRKKTTEKAARLPFTDQLLLSVIKARGFASLTFVQVCLYKFKWLLKGNQQFITLITKHPLRGNNNL
jgi:hypothetical protein